MISEERFLEVTAQVMTDTLPLQLNLQIKDAWLVTSALQAITRHPMISDQQRAMFRELAQTYEAAIVLRHPEAKPLVEMGWDERFDVVKGDTEDMNPPPPPAALKPVNNCWTIYAADAKPGEPAFCQMGRPQDWGDPRWMYRVYALETQEYRNTVHCWLDVQVQEFEHLQTFMPVIAQIMLPGWPVELSGRDYMGEDDFWSRQWGEMPPFFDRDEDY